MLDQTIKQQLKALSDVHNGYEAHYQVEIYCVNAGWPTLGTKDHGYMLRRKQGIEVLQNSIPRGGGFITVMFLHLEGAGND